MKTVLPVAASFGLSVLLALVAVQLGGAEVGQVSAEGSSVVVEAASAYGNIDWP
ncbi:hypothetical protein [Streptomyces sp. NPDC058256]|uniref:hypothetical protein n=1 Tax=Streptomyces sp. NPDC058256 TaxID=3346408 RepID=UPI0036E85FB8